MNRPALGLILICCRVWAIETNDYSKYILTQEHNKFEDFLEYLKSILKKGDESLGIPILDPFTAEKVPIKIDQEVLNFDILFTDVDARGLSEYDVIRGDFKALGLKFLMNLSWPLISASTYNYDIKGKASYFDVHGNGEIKASARDLAFEAEIHLALNSRYLKVKETKTSLSLRAFDFQMTGLFDNDELSELLSVVISDTVPQLISDYQDTITKNLNLLVTEKLDVFFSDKTLEDLLKLILGSMSQLSVII